jgi:hypothetical protein
MPVLKQLYLNISAFGIFLVILPCGVLGQSEFNLQGTTWYIERAVKGTNTSQTSMFRYGENLLKVNRDGTYRISNFLGISQLEGELVYRHNTLVLSNQNKSGIFWVFHVQHASPDELRLLYIPYQNSASTLEIVLKPFLEETTASTVLSPEAAEFKGQWLFKRNEQFLSIELTQNGNIIIGKHCTSSDCSKAYAVSGIAQGKTAQLTLAYNGVEIARGELILSSKDIAKWYITSSTTDELSSYDRVTLTRMKIE